MKKRLIYFVAAIFLSVQALSSCVMAAGSPTAVKNAANKYKAGNYVGCLQDCLNITYHDPKNAMAYYYMAMSYAQSEQKDKAIAAYSKVLSLSPNAMLADYATTGKRCLETPEQCDPTANKDASSEEIDKLLASPNSDGLSSSVKKDLEQQQLNNIKNQMNNGQDLDNNSMKLLNDASGQTAPTKNTTATESKQSSEENIAAAMKVLNEAGVNPYSQVGNYQNPQAMQLQMLQSLNNNPVASPNDSNAMLNMIPMMMQQSKTGQGNYSPQLMQAFIMNSLTGNMDFNKNENSNDFNN
jgi:tetratricopeptide (TPR) repeat protein